MKSMATRTVVAMFGLAAVAASGAVWAAGGGAKGPITGDAGRGRVLADKWCASCHAPGADRASDQVPSFAAIAKTIGAKPEALRVFLRAPHKPMPPLQLTNQEVEDLAVFIEGRK